MKKRWISLYVENEVGVLAKIAGLFSGKSYNLMSLTVGTTEDSTMSRMTISVESDDATFEQIKKQLNRCVEVIEVIDFTNCPIHRKEVLYIKVKKCDEKIKMKCLELQVSLNFRLWIMEKKKFCWNVCRQKPGMMK